VYFLLKNKIKIFYKRLVSVFFSYLYGEIKILSDSKVKKKINLYKLKIKNYSFSLYKLQDCRIYTNYSTDIAYIIDNFITHPSIQYRNDVSFGIEHNEVLKNGTPKLLKKTNLKILSVLTGGGGNANYFHWLFDVLPRIFLFKKLFNLKQVDKILVPNIKYRFQYQTLKLLNIKKYQIINNESYKHICGKEVYATSHPSENSENISPILIDFLKKSFLKKTDNIKKKIIKKIYIDRSDSKSQIRDYRSITNEEEIFNYLKKKGFIKVKLAELDFIEQVYLFYNANCIFGLHGAGFSNLIFCKKNTKIIEVKPYGATTIYKNLAKKCRLNYFGLEIKPISKSIGLNYGRIFLPLKKIKNLIP
jgi:hypothetical protein